MSLIKGLLNWYLRTFERAHLERATDPEALRKSFDQKARFLFHAPFGMTVQDSEIGGRPGLDIAPITHAATLLYFHGGAYVFGNPKTHAAMVSHLAKKAGARAILQDYRKAPEDPFPSAIEDAEAAWLDLIASGVDPAQVVIGGDSAGGGLALSLLGMLLEKQYPLPAGVFAFSPLTDMTFSGASIVENCNVDTVLPAGRVAEMAEMYLGKTGRDDPRASPIFADFKGAPPIYLMVGDTEILRDDTLRLQTQMVAQNVDVTVDLRHDLPHVWPIFHNTLPEARQTLTELAHWIRQQTATISES